MHCQHAHLYLLCPNKHSFKTATSIRCIYTCSPHIVPHYCVASQIRLLAKHLFSMHAFHENSVGNTKAGNFASRSKKKSLLNTSYLFALHSYNQSPLCLTNTEKEKPVLVEIQTSGSLAFAWLIFKEQELTGKEQGVVQIFRSLFQWSNLFKKCYPLFKIYIIKVFLPTEWAWKELQT